MPNPKDLTGQLYKLKKKGTFSEGPLPPVTEFPKAAISTPSPRALKSDYFAYGVYTLLFLIVLAQLSLIVWMDLL